LPSGDSLNKAVLFGGGGIANLKLAREENGIFALCWRGWDGFFG
jgi:hypothetical protein